MLSRATSRREKSQVLQRSPQTPHAISCIGHVLLYDWPSHLREQISRTFQFRNCHGKFFCSFWCIHGNDPRAVSVWGKRLHTKRYFPVGKRYLPIGKRASVTTAIDGLQFSWINSLRAVEATSFPGSLFSASLNRWNRDPGCDWSRDYLSIQNRRVGGYSSIFGREDDKIPHPSSRFWVVTWPAATRVSLPTTKGGREDTPWERGCCRSHSLRCRHGTRLQVARLWD